MSDVLEVRNRETDEIVHTIAVKDADSHDGQKTLRSMVRRLDNDRFYVTISYASEAKHEPS